MSDHAEPGSDGFAAHFSSTVVGVALSTAADIGLIDQLVASESFHVDAFAKDRGMHATRLGAVLDVLEHAGVIRREGSMVERGPSFDSASANAHYFHWLVRGCGELLVRTPDVLTGSASAMSLRDTRAITTASRRSAAAYLEPLLDRLLPNGADLQVADLGCGGGGRLVDLCARQRAAGGLGMDISRDAIGLARASAHDAGVDDRVRFVEADVTALGDGCMYPEVGAVVCVYLGHDFWPLDRCVRVLSDVRRVFPNASHLLLAEVFRFAADPTTPRPIFALGYEFVHGLMDVTIPTHDEWFAAFEPGGWTCKDEHPVLAPPNCSVFELVPA